MNFLITGVAGFIGFHLSDYLLKKKHKIFGVDDLNSYYEVELKKKQT
jgi:UDP-glucuronate 4-epimerase